MKAFEVIRPGILTTIQDLGRPGFMKYGIPASGAADRFSCQVANWLLGNESAAAVLEVTLGGLEMVACNAFWIAVTGGDLSPVVNGEGVPMWQAVFLRKGDRLALRRRRMGFRSYIAIPGGFSAPLFLGSRSVWLQGLMGEKISSGKVLETDDNSRKGTCAKSLSPEMIPRFSDQPCRIMLGPQEDRFTTEGIGAFLGSEYRIQPQSDRMGYRLEGPKVEHRSGADILSEPIARGAIQIPGDGLPILILWDGQVSGGYTKIGHVISADWDWLAQRMPGEKLRFKAIALEEAHRAYREARDFRGKVQNFIQENVASRTGKG
jgi:antagonist of KipI